MNWKQMTEKQIIKTAGKLAKPFRVTRGGKFRLKDVDPGDTLDFSPDDKPELQERLAANGIRTLAELQDKLHAQDKWAVLLILQARERRQADIAGEKMKTNQNVAAENTAAELETTGRQCAGRRPKFVAQTTSLLYRGFPICNCGERTDAPAVASSRRLEAGDTAGWKPALRQGAPNSQTSRPESKL